MRPDEIVSTGRPDKVESQPVSPLKIFIKLEISGVWLSHKVASPPVLPMNKHHVHRSKSPTYLILSAEIKSSFCLLEPYTHRPLIRPAHSTANQILNLSVHRFSSANPASPSQRITTFQIQQRRRQNKLKIYITQTKKKPLKSEPTSEPATWVNHPIALCLRLLSLHRPVG